MKVIFSENPDSPLYSLVEFSSPVRAEFYFPRQIRRLMYRLTDSYNCYLVHRDDLTNFMKYIVHYSSGFEILPGNRICCSYDRKRRYIHGV